MTRRPGTSVYLAYDHEDAVLYVGLTGQGISRAFGHQESSAWWEQMAYQRWEHFASRNRALEREAELITILQPPYNIAGRSHPCPSCGFITKDYAGYCRHHGVKHPDVERASREELLGRLTFESAPCTSKPPTTITDLDHAFIQEVS